MPSPILRDTIKKLKARRALLQRQIKGPLEELRQIEDDLEALGAGTPRRPARRSAPGARARPGANQAAILRAVRNGATTPAEIAEQTGLAEATVSRTVADLHAKQKLLVEGPNGLALTATGRARLRALDGR